MRSRFFLFLFLFAFSHDVLFQVGYLESLLNSNFPPCVAPGDFQGLKRVLRESSGGELSETLEEAFDEVRDWNALYVLCALKDLENSVIPPLPAVAVRQAKEEAVVPPAREMPSEAKAVSQPAPQESVSDLVLMLEGCRGEMVTEAQRRCGAAGEAVRRAEAQLERLSQNEQHEGRALLAERLRALQSAQIDSPLAAVAASQRADLMAPLVTILSKESWSAQLAQRGGRNALLAERMKEAESRENRVRLKQCRNGLLEMAAPQGGWFDEACWERAQAARRERDSPGALSDLSDHQMSVCFVQPSRLNSWLREPHEEELNAWQRRVQLLSKPQQTPHLNHDASWSRLQHLHALQQQQLCMGVLQQLLSRETEGLTRLRKEEGARDPQRLRLVYARFVTFLQDSLTDKGWRALDQFLAGSDEGGKNCVLTVRAAAAHHMPSHSMLRLLDFNRFYEK